MAWRMHNLVWAAKQALHIDGDFIECGVFRGFKSYSLLKYLTSELQKRRFFLCDTFNGIDPELMDGSPVSPDEHRKVGLHDFVAKRFRDIQIISNNIYSKRTI